MNKEKIHKQRVIIERTVDKTREDNVGKMR